MRALIFAYIKEEVAHAHAQNGPLERFLSTPVLARCRAEAVERILLVAYLVIDICAVTTDQVRIWLKEYE